VEWIVIIVGGLLLYSIFSVAREVSSAAREIKTELREIRTELYGGGIRSELFDLRNELQSTRLNLEAQTGVRTTFKSNFKSTSDAVSGHFDYKGHADFNTTRGLPLSSDHS
jgi:hypothetical protein